MGDFLGLPVPTQRHAPLAMPALPLVVLQRQIPFGGLVLFLLLA